MEISGEFSEIFCLFDQWHWQMFKQFFLPNLLSLGAICHSRQASPVIPLTARPDCKQTSEHKFCNPGANLSNSDVITLYKCWNLVMNEAIKSNDRLCTYEIEMDRFKFQNAKIKLRHLRTKMINMQIVCMINDNGILNLWSKFHNEL